MADCVCRRVFCDSDLHLTPPVHRAEGHGGTAMLGMIELTAKDCDLKQVIMFEADDGKQFTNAKNCKEYEQRCGDIFDALKMLESGATLMAVLVRAYQTLPYWDARLTVEDRAILNQATKDTPFVVSHWQCHDKPGYKFCDLNHKVQVFLHGDASSWSGAYGSWLDLSDFLRHARNTPRRCP